MSVFDKGLDMMSWTSCINDNPIKWLLEEEDPSVRYITLTDILGRSLDDSEVVDTKKQIMKHKVIQKILENTFNGRFITNIETKDRPSKWITLNALRVLKRYYDKRNKC